MTFYRKTSESTRSISLYLGDGIEAFLQPVKCVIVGDSCVGKTALLTAYINGTFLADYQPTVFNTFKKQVICDDHVLDLTLYDLTGKSDLKQFRSKSYLETDVIILCFSVTCAESFDNVINKWMPEIKQYLPNKPFLLVGTKTDLRKNRDTLTNLSKTNQSPIEYKLARNYALTCGAFRYIECSATDTASVNKVFDKAIKKALESYVVSTRPSSCNIS